MYVMTINYINNFSQWWVKGGTWMQQIILSWHYCLGVGVEWQEKVLVEVEALAHTSFKT